jgi:pyrroloquinoline quinone (PQQ) biosynthesis protein C
MLQVDDSEFTQDHIEFLQEWAEALGVSVEVLLARIVLATSEGDQYVEKVPDYRP